MMVFGLALAVALFVALAILMKAARMSFARPFPTGVDMVVRAEGEPCEWALVKLATNLNPIPEEKLEEIMGLPFVEEAAGILVTWVFTDLEVGLRQDARRDSEPEKTASKNGLKPVTIIGIDPAHLSLSPVGPKDIISGRFLEKGAEDEMVIEEEFAILINKKSGDTLNLDNRTFKIVGIAALLKDTGFRAQGYVDIGSARKMLNRGEIVNTVFIRLIAGGGGGIGMDMQLAQGQIRGIIGPSANIITTRDYFIMLGQVSQAERIYLVTFFLIIATISVLFILQSVFSYIGEKTRDFGVLKAIGWRRVSMIKMAVYENAFIGCAGGALGFAGGYLLTLFHKARSIRLPYFLNPIPPCNITGTDVNFTVSVEPAVYLGIFLSSVITSVFLGVILGYLAALKVTRINASCALRSI